MILHVRQGAQGPSETILESHLYQELLSQRSSADTEHLGRLVRVLRLMDLPPKFDLSDEIAFDENEVDQGQKAYGASKRIVSECVG